MSTNMQAHNRAKTNALMEGKNQYEVSHAMEKVIKESGMNKNRLEPNSLTMAKEKPTQDKQEDCMKCTLYESLFSLSTSLKRHRKITTGN